MRPSSRSTVVSASRSAWRRGNSTWTMPDRRYDRTVGSSGMSRSRRLRGSLLAVSSRLGGRHRIGVGIGLTGFDLDSDVEHLGRLAIAGAHQVEVADEAPDGAGRETLGAALVADLVIERSDLGDQVGLLLGVDRLDREPARRRCEQVVAAVRVTPRFADLGEGPDARQRRDALRADLAPVPDQNHPERLARIEAMPCHRLIAIFEDMER